MNTENSAARGDDALVDPTLSRLEDLDRTVAIPDEDIRGRMVKGKGWS